MIDLVVFRGAGDRFGGEIFDPLLSDVLPALQRGKYEIDFNTPKIVHTLTVEYTPALRPGEEVSVRDDAGGVFFGVVREFHHVREGVTCTSRVVVEGPQ